MTEKSKIVEIFDYMRNCPQLAKMLSIAGKEEIGNSIIYPQGSSQAFNIREKLDTLDGYEADIVPLPSVYEDFQINCYQFYDENDSTQPNGNINVLSYEEVDKICQWIQNQDEIGNLPEITGENVINIECLPLYRKLDLLTKNKI